MKVKSEVLFLIVAAVSLASLILIAHYSPFLPDYDGLQYLSNAKGINSWFFSHNNKLSVLVGDDAYSYLPITNTLSVCVASLFWNIFNLNLIPILINAFYLFIFAAYIKEIKGVSYAYISVIILCSQTFFFRLFTTFTSEFAVGIWIFSFIVTLISNHKSRTTGLLVLSIVGIFLRNINIVFIFTLTVTYISACIIFYRGRAELKNTVISIVAGQVIAGAVFFQNYFVVYDYMLKASTGDMAECWKRLGGVSARWDIPVQYWKYILLYNSFIIPTLLILTILLAVVNIKSYKKILLPFSLSGAIIAPLLVSKTLNIQVVFFVYVCISFIICELLVELKGEGKQKSLINRIQLSNKNRNAVYLAVLIVAIPFLVNSWRWEVGYLNGLKEVSEISSKITAALDSENGEPTISCNYWGVGPLDFLGLNLCSNKKYTYVQLKNIIYKKHDPIRVLDRISQANYLILAHDNYFFPPCFPVNDEIKSTYMLFLNLYKEYGFKMINEISVNGRKFDIWYKPNAVAHLQYQNDAWISRSLPIDIGTNKNKTVARSISGSVDMALNFPDSGEKDYQPPFRVSLTKANSQEVIATRLVNSFGLSEVSFVINSISDDAYEVKIDKAFNPKNDSRQLSAQLIKINSHLKYN